MTELEGCIKFWESKLFHDRFLMEPSTIFQVEATVRFLKRLQEYEAKESNTPLITPQR